MGKLSVAFCLLFLFVANLEAMLYDTTQTQGFSDAPIWAEGILIVKFAPQVQAHSFKKMTGQISTGLLRLDEKFAEHDVRKLEPLFGSPLSGKAGSEDMARYYRVEFPADRNLQLVIADLAALPEIERVEPVGIHPGALVPNDGGFSSQWHHQQGGDHDIDTPAAWDIETGDSAVIIAIVDTGVLWSHPDLAGQSPYTAGNIWINWSEQNGTSGVDDDGNGYIDDYRGWDWVQVSGAWPGEDATTPDNNPTDFNGHGTHCAGIAAAITNNGTGVAGVAGGLYPSTRGVKIMALRAGWSAPHPQEGYETGYVRMDFCASAFYYAVNQGADVISCSWGSSNSGGIEAALNYAVANGVVICKAAGNEANSFADYLCSLPTVISVASTNSSDTKSSFSCYGTWVDISAPGSNIYSTDSNHGTATYASLSGTSMSTPMTAGVAALIKSRNTALGKTDIENILFNSADDIDALNPQYAGLLGAGRVNAFNAVTQMVYGTFEATPRIGPPPLTVNFSGNSPFEVTSWKYRFGDGDSSDLQNPVHVYTEPGAYSVDFSITTATGNYSENADSFIFVLADTLAAGEYENDPGPQNIMIPIRLGNIAPIDEIILPLVFAGSVNLTNDSFTVAGTRAGYFENVSLIAASGTLKKLVFKLEANSGGGALPLGAGEGEILRLYFHTASSASGINPVDTTTHAGYSLNISTYLGDYVPVFEPGQIILAAALRGDANGDDIVDVSDAVYIINYIFADGLPPVSACGGDANSDGYADVSDAVFIIDYVFVPGSPAPEPCY